MRIGGFGKLTLQDYPGHVAAIGFTTGCQLRCPYCHNAELVLTNQLDSGAEQAKALEFLAYLEQRKNRLDGVVISGGEPLLQPDLADFLHQIKAFGLAIKLDTNGLLTGRLRELIDRNLVDYVALDYKNCRETFARTVGLSEPEQQATAQGYYDSWQTSLSYLRECQVSYELRTTVVRELHPIDALEGMAGAIRAAADGGEHWFLQTFAKSGPLICNYLPDSTSLSAYSSQEMESIRRRLMQQAPGVQCR
jgi:pyruvate formate lyase activating enzyme